ncbi:hypothetical protein DEO72_LG11g2069 [Vigna unguiculata]|uniref:Uncharacterized protein n=1 Tax=Vigna unguiculata TaxID=3917 RepID=A0A4D6NQ50_VIGUN|nr:hypothetical protein DEO72_LG11g2069 [Vigna unguiculata]
MPSKKGPVRGRSTITWILLCSHQVVGGHRKRRYSRKTCQARRSLGSRSYHPTTPKVSPLRVYD